MNVPDAPPLDAQGAPASEPPRTDQAPTPGPTNAAAPTQAAGDLAALRAQMDVLTAERDTLAREKAEIAASQAKAREDAASRAGDVDSLRTELEQRHGVETAALRAQIEQAGELNRKLLVDDGLTKALATAEIAEPLRPAVVALLKARNRFEILDGQARMNSQPLADAVNLWASGPDAAPFKAASLASGSGATAGSASGPGANFKNADGTVNLTLLKGLKATDPAAYAAGLRAANFAS